jgi:hypothetical protein
MEPPAVLHHRVDGRLADVDPPARRVKHPPTRFVE